MFYRGMYVMMVAFVTVEMVQAASESNAKNVLMRSERGIYFCCHPGHELIHKIALADVYFCALTDDGRDGLCHWILEGNSCHIEAADKEVTHKMVIPDKNEFIKRNGIVYGRDGKEVDQLYALWFDRFDKSNALNDSPPSKKVCANHHEDRQDNDSLTSDSDEELVFPENAEREVESVESREDVFPADLSAVAEEKARK